MAGAYHALLEHTARLLHAAGDAQGAIARLTDLLTRDHCNEPAARLLKECYDAQGERAAAARVYHTLRVRLQDELHVLPGPRTEELYASIRRAPVTPTATRTVLSVQRRRQPRPSELNPPVRREEELARAEHVLDDVRQHGGVYALFVQEEAGVGKSYVAHEILNRVRQRGFTVLVGAARGWRRALCLPDRGPEAARARAVSVPTQTLRAVLTAAPGVAAPLPEVAAHRECAPAVMPQDTRLQRDVVHALATVCAGQPTALQLDDLHDADEATLAVVRDLVWIGFPAGLLRSTIAPAR
ncbi:MAG TPA: AAA family ATPase [Chloroflexota bacterium]|nr:AAA family ATPase [Chloroflexota bacterium]